MQSIDRTYELDHSVPLNVPLKPAKSNLSSLASAWARRYLQTVRPEVRKPLPQGRIEQLSLQQVNTLRNDRSTTAIKLNQVIRRASAQAWAKTEMLLKDELHHHQIPPELINPWEISADVHRVFARVIRAYRKGVSVQQMSRSIGHDCGHLRLKYTQSDPRAIGFVSMQAHYTGQMLLEHLNQSEIRLFSPYLKVIDDYLYLPLQDTYLAAASHAPDSDALRAVQSLLPVSTRIARKVYKRVNHQNPGYASYSGHLASPSVKTSSIRDIEMFQVYLCLCLLEGNVRSVQEQLFPLCVMLYPKLHVSWELVQEMLETLGWEMHKRLLPSDMMQFLPYLRTLGHMFSKEVFEAEG